MSNTPVVGVRAIVDGKSTTYERANQYVSFGGELVLTHQDDSGKREIARVAAGRWSAVELVYGPPAPVESAVTLTALAVELARRRLMLVQVESSQVVEDASRVLAEAHRAHEQAKRDEK